MHLPTSTGYLCCFDALIEIGALNDIVMLCNRAQQLTIWVVWSQNNFSFDSLQNEIFLSRHQNLTLNLSLTTPAKWQKPLPFIDWLWNCFDITIVGFFVNIKLTLVSHWTIYPWQIRTVHWKSMASDAMHLVVKFFYFPCIRRAHWEIIFINHCSNTH